MLELDLLTLDVASISDDEAMAIATLIEAQDAAQRWQAIVDTFPHHDETQWPYTPFYEPVFEWRRATSTLLQGDGGLRSAAFYYYRHDRPAEFTEHWGTTFDPRNGKGARKHLPRKMPMLLFKRQRDLFDCLLACTNQSEAGLIEKARDMGATWVCCFFSIWQWVFQPGSAVGWGSRKEELVDHRGDPKCIFEKLRMGIEHLPDVFKPAGFNPREHMTFMTIVNPENGSTIIGEAGDNIGRGGRTGVYFKDEAAHYVRPESIEAALGDNTDVQIDISSVNGLGNVFHRRREAGKVWTGGAIEAGEVAVFIMDWSEHPGKTPEWHEARRSKAEREGLLHVFEQEVNRNYAASVEGIIIQADWVKSAIDAHIVLGIEEEAVQGGWRAALDVAGGDTEGEGDTNADAFFEGIILRHVDNWGAKDPGYATRKFIADAEGKGEIELGYDCIGVGVGVKQEANRLEEEGMLPPRLRFVPWNAAASPLDADKPMIDDDRDSPLNGDFYENLKAQGWWRTRLKFERTHKAVQAKLGKGDAFTYRVEDLISIDSSIPLLRQIEKELSQPTATRSKRMKLVVNKTPEGTRSPNVGDAIIMADNPTSGLRPIITIAKNEFACAPFRLPAHFKRGFAMFVEGQSCRVLWGAHDADADVLYFTTEYIRDHAEPATHAQAILARGRWIPGTFDCTETNLKHFDEIMRQYHAFGIGSFHAAAALGGPASTGGFAAADRAVEAGIGDLQQRIATGRLKVFSTCQNFFVDYRGYRRDEDGKIVGGGLMNCARQLARPIVMARMIVEPKKTVLGQAGAPNLYR
jgi:phage terminase large subunit